MDDDTYVFELLSRLWEINFIVMIFDKQKKVKYSFVKIKWSSFSLKNWNSSTNVKCDFLNSSEEKMTLSVILNPSLTPGRSGCGRSGGRIEILKYGSNLANQSNRCDVEGQRSQVEMGRSLDNEGRQQVDKEAHRIAT